MRDRQLAYIRKVLTLTGWSQSLLAKRAGLDPSTLSRFLSHDREDHELRPASIARISEITGVPWIDATEKLQNQSSLQEQPCDAETEAVQILEPPVLPSLSPDKTAEVWRLQSRALELAGYLPGDLLYMYESDVPLAGDVVGVDVYGWNRQAKQRIFRIYEPPYLVTATVLSTLLRPLLIDKLTTDIRGVVAQSLRPHRRSK